MQSPKTPGVYIQEIPSFPPSVAAVETAIPVFIGYTEKAVDANGDSLVMKPRKISSLLNYENLYGKSQNEIGISVEIRENGDRTDLDLIKVSIDNRSPFRMHYAMQLFFANGGGDCYIVSTGLQEETPLLQRAALSNGLSASNKEDEITLIVFPDAPGLGDGDFYGLYSEALVACQELQDRFTIIDVWIDEENTNPDADAGAFIDTNIATLRDGIGGTTDQLKYGAAYFPNIRTTLDYQFDDAGVAIVQNGGDGSLEGTFAELKEKRNDYYFRVLAKLQEYPVEMTPSAAMAGLYAETDQSRGVWKAPANINVRNAVETVVRVDDRQQAGLNVDVVAGKSVNVIRPFTGRGAAIVWGARTLAGNDNEWRYVSVRRFFNMVEESVKKASIQFVFEPNDANTWTRIKSMISNFLTLQWRAGALMGSTPEQAFFVNVGLNETMSQTDILEGRMIIEIGMAVVRPAEFIILKFSHKMLEA
ncbi:MAG: phage tail sheath C-terminal domain-containing protein [Bacteroidota bacterium]